jgi:hypothetical protein
MVYMNELSEMIRNYIHECFDNHNVIPSDDQIYTHFQAYEPSEHIIEKEIHFFFDSYFILEDTEIEWEGNLDTIHIEREEVQNETSRNLERC